MISQLSILRSSESQLRVGARQSLLVCGVRGAKPRGARKKERQAACKPGSVPVPHGAVDGHSSGTSVAGRLARPTRATRRKRRLPRRSPLQGPAGRPPLCGLAPGGVCPAAAVARSAVRSYRTISPLPAAARATSRRYVSVALSLRSPSPGVTRHRVSVEPGLSSPRPKGRKAAIRPSGGC